MENTEKVTGVCDLDFDKREFSAVHIMDGWTTWAMRDVIPSIHQVTNPCFTTAEERLRKLLELLGGMNTPLSMLITGILIASGDLGSILRDKHIWKLDISPHRIFRSAMRS